MLTLDDYLLLCGSGGDGRVCGDSSGGSGGRVSGGGGGGGRVGGGSDNGNGCRWLWLLFIIINILFYCNRYIILLWCLYYFIVLKDKIDPLLLDVL